MVTKAEMHKKMIKTILEQLPQYIKRYSPEDQGLLHEFLNLLSEYKKAEKKRTDLINNYDEYNKRIFGTEKYLNTPFLWFTVDYFQKARLTLNWTNFQAVSFYEYLAKFLRKNPSYYGVYELIRKQTPLTDGKWEQLQYACRKMLKPLSKEQIKIIEGVVSIIENQGIYALDPKIIKKKLTPILQIGTKIDKVLAAFLTNLESQWYLNYHTPAFGIERLSFHIEGIKTKIDEIINFQNQNNTILCLSDIYVSRDNLDEYLGVFYVPTKDIKALITLLKNHEQRGTFKLLELAHIKNSVREISLEKYAVNEGWPKIGKAELLRLYNLITIENREKVTKKNNLTYIAPKFNENWQFNQHQLPIELIKVYCDVHIKYKYSELHMALVNQKREKKQSKNFIGLLKQLEYNNILCIDWIPWRLVYEYSLDPYWIKVPRKYLNNAKHLLEIVPFSTTYLSDEKFYLWLHLTPQIAKWIKNELNWEIYPITRYSTPITPNFNWFNQEELRWRTPRILMT